METAIRDQSRPADAAAVPHASADGRAVWVAAGLLVLHAALAWLGREPGIGTGQDDAWYYLLSRDLLGLKYRDAFMVGAPVHQQYPPGYPLLLALWAPFRGLSFGWLVGLNILFSTAALALAFDATRRVLGSGVAVLGLAVLAVNPFLLERAGLLMSEPAFLFFSMLALWLLVRQPEGPVWGVIAAAVMAAMVRSVGLTLLVALAVHWSLERRWRAVGALAVASVLTVGVWLGWTALAPNKVPGRSYVADLGARLGGPDAPLLAELVRRVVRGMRFYATSAFPWLIRSPTIPATLIDNAVTLGVHALAIAAGGVLLLRRWRVAALYVLVTLGVLLFWVWRVNRFLLPLLPVLVPALIAGVGWWVGKWRRALAFPVMLGFSLVLVGSALADDVEEVAVRWRCGESTDAWPAAGCLEPRAQHFFEAVAYVKDRLPADAAVYVSKSAPFHLYTGRLAAPVTDVASRPLEDRLAYLRELGVGYVLLTELHHSDFRQILPLVEAECEALEVEAEFGEDTMLFRVRGAGGRTRADACEAAARFRRAGRDTNDGTPDER